MTQLLHEWFWLLAASTNGQVWGRFDHGRPTYGAAQLLTILTFVALAITIGLLLVRMRSSFQTESRRGLFNELCRAHGLKTSSRRLLRRLAAARGLRDAATLFVEPRYFESNELPDALQAVKAELQPLRDRIFNMDASVRVGMAAPGSAAGP
jgi:hypothetical protein